MIHGETIDKKQKFEYIRGRNTQKIEVANCHSKKRRKGW